MNIPSPALRRSSDDAHYGDGCLMSGPSSGPLSQIATSVSAHAAACLMSLFVYPGIEGGLAAQTAMGHREEGFFKASILPRGDPSFNLALI